MTDIIICEKCGSVMEPIDPVHPVGMTCPKCGWGWATSFIDPILEDSTEYVITLLEDNTAIKGTLKAVAKLANCNLIQAKRLIESAPTEIVRGKASEVKEAIRVLEAEALHFTVTPSFPYQTDQ